MKILVLQYEMMEDGGYVLPTHMGGTVDIILPPEVTHIIIQKEEVHPRTIYKIYGVDENELGRR